MGHIDQFKTLEGLEKQKFQASTESRLINHQYGLVIRANSTAACLCCQGSPYLWQQIQIFPPAGIGGLPALQPQGPGYEPVAPPGPDVPLLHQTSV